MKLSERLELRNIVSSPAAQCEAAACSTGSCPRTRDIYLARLQLSVDTQDGKTNITLIAKTDNYHPDFLPVHDKMLLRIPFRSKRWKDGVCRLWLAGTAVGNNRSAGSR